MRQATAARCCWGQPLRSRPARLPAARPLRQPAQAQRSQEGGSAGSPAAQAGAGGGAVRRRRWCQSVTFLVPDRADPDRTHRLRGRHITQHDLYSILDRLGAVGFVADDGILSLQLEDLPECGTVRLVLAGQPWTAEQGVADSSELAQEQLLAALLWQHAIQDNAGGSLTTLPMKPFKRASGQDYVQMDAAVVAGGTLYVAELRRMLDQGSMATLLLTKIRAALSGGDLHDLAAALHGVTHVKQFLAGEGLRAGVSQERLAKRAADKGMGLVLPSVEGLDLVAAPSALPLQRL